MNIFIFLFIEGWCSVHFDFVIRYGTDFPIVSRHAPFVRVPGPSTASAVVESTKGERGERGGWCSVSG